MFNRRAALALALLALALLPGPSEGERVLSGTAAGPKWLGPVCEGGSTTLSCSSGYKISSINSAFYGRSDSSTCPYGDTNAMRNTECSLSTALSETQAQCVGQRSCTPKLSVDPCLGTYKWFSASYTCAPAGGPNPTTTRACFTKTYGRGAGSVLDSCPPNTEKNGALCYPLCKSGYYGVGPVCWQSCPSGYKDDGALCRRDAHIYGKGCCCTIWGCCNKCPSDYKEDGCTCRKDAHIFAKSSYGRGAGNVLVCRQGLEQDGGLCYPPCASGYKGVGPVCWASGAPNGLPVRCNDIGWGVDDGACNEMNDDFTSMGVKLGVGVGVCLASLVAAAVTGGLLAPLAASVCPEAISVAAGSIENMVHLGKYSLCPM